MRSERRLFGPDDALLEQHIAIEPPLAGLDDGKGAMHALIKGEALDEAERHLRLVLLDDPFSKKESGELVLEYLKELEASPNPIAILAPKLISARVKKIAQVSEKVFELEGKEKEAQGFNFALTHALSSKTEGALWLELQRAYRRGEAPEALHGLLHWKARELMKKGNMEGRALSTNLILLMSDARKGTRSLGESLELFSLRN